MMIPDDFHDFQMGRVVNRAFWMLGRNLPIFLGLAALFLVPDLIVTLYNGRTSAVTLMLIRAFPTIGPRNLAFLVAQSGSLLESLSTGLLQAALTQGVLSEMRGERPTFSMCVITPFRSFGPLIAIGFLYYVGVIGGIALLLIPGIIASTAWILAVPVRVSEHTKILESFERSLFLTRGYRLPIAGWVLIYLLAALLAELIFRIGFRVSLFSAGTVLYGNPVYLILRWLFQIIMVTIGSMGVASLYYELRLVKEGSASSQLASAFD
jgi:hypothetical protein